MGHGVLFECSRSLVESWWVNLGERGLFVDLHPPLSIVVASEPDGVRYRTGSVRNGIAIVDIIPCPGPPPHSQSPLCGKYYLLMRFKESSKNDSALANVIGNLLIELGASKVTQIASTKRKALPEVGEENGGRKRL